MEPWSQQFPPMAWPPPAQASRPAAPAPSFSTLFTLGQQFDPAKHLTAGITAVAPGHGVARPNIGVSLLPLGELRTTDPHAPLPAAAASAIPPPAIVLGANRGASLNTAEACPTSSFENKSAQDDEITIMFGLRASKRHDTATPYLMSVCEPVVLTAGEAGRSLVDALLDLHSSLPEPMRALIKNLLNVSSQLAEIVRISGGTAVTVPSGAGWHWDIPSGPRNPHSASVPTAPPPPSLVPPFLPPKSALAPPPVATSARTVPRVSQPLRSDRDDLASLAWRADLRRPPSKPDLSPLAEPRPRSHSHSPAPQANSLPCRDHELDRGPVPAAIPAGHVDAPQSSDSSPMSIARHCRSRSRSPDYRSGRDRDHERDHDCAYGPAAAISRIDRDRAYGPAAAASHPDRNSRQFDPEYAHAPRGPRRPPSAPYPDGTLVPTPVPATASVAAVDRFRVPSKAQCKGMVPFIVTAYGGTATDLLPHFNKLEAVIADMQLVHIDEAHDQVMFYVPNGKTVVADVMRASGVIVGGMLLDFVPVGRQGLSKSDMHRRNVFVIVHPPRDSMVVIRALADMEITGAFIDKSNVPLPGTKIPFAFLTIPAFFSSLRKEVEEMRLGSKKSKIFHIKGPKSSFSSPTRIHNILSIIADKIA